jgi:glycosyltransferase involved in cell wall biosynthesis
MGKKLSILFISEYFPPKVMGGGEINLFLITKALVKKKIEVIVLTSSHKGLKEYELMDGVKVYRRLKTGDDAYTLLNNLKRSFTYPKSIIEETSKMINEINIDLIHFIGTSIITAKELSKLAIPLVSTIESYPTMCPKGDRLYNGEQECKKVCNFSMFVKCQMKSKEIGKMKNKWFLKYNPIAWIYLYWFYKNLNEGLKYSTNIAISNYIDRLLQKHGSKGIVIPNAINTSQFYKQKNKNKKKKILYLGSYTQFKGPQILLKAIKGTNYHCDLYGQGSMKEELKEMINKDKLDAEVHEVVSYEEIPRLYAETDVVVFPSLWPEPFGRISIEAMAAGKLVIGSDVGGISETIKPGTGILVEPNNPSKLVKAINKALKIKFNNKISETIVKQYEEKIIIEKLVKTYNTILEQ